MKTYTFFIMTALMAVILLAPISVSAQQMTPSQSSLVQIISKRKVNLKTNGYNGSFGVAYQSQEGAQKYGVGLNGTFDGVVVSKNSQSIDSAEGTYSLRLTVDQNLAKAFGISDEFVTFQIKSLLEKNQKYTSYARITSGSAYIQKTLALYAQELKIKSPVLFSWFKLPGASTLTRESTVDVSTKYTPQQQQFIMEKFVTALDIKQDKGVEQVNAFYGRHFVLGLTAEKFKQFLIDIAPVTEKTPMTAVERQELDKMYADPIAQEVFSKTSIDAWLGENDGKIYKLTIKADRVSISKSQNTPTYIDYILDVNLKDVPATYKVVKPAKFIDLDALYKKSLGDARVKARDASIKANLSSLRPYAELYLDKNGGNGYSSFCISDSGFKSIQTSMSQQGNNLFCRDNRSGFVAYAKTSEGYFCVDSFGRAIKLNAVPAVKSVPSCI